MSKKIKNKQEHGKIFFFKKSKKKERISLAAAQKRKWREAKTKSKETREAAFSNIGKNGGDLRQGGNEERVGSGTYTEAKGAGLADGLTGYEM